MKQVLLNHELSRPLKVERISRGGIREKIVATPDERKALCERFGLIDLSRLEATIDVDHAEGKMLKVKGKLYADVVQECVVSLEPVPAQVLDDIDVLFAPPHLIKQGDEGPMSDFGDAEIPEPIENGMIDLGELTAQHLAMALEPYPRKEGIELGPYEVKGKGGKSQEKKEPAKENPFAKLAAAFKKEDDIG